MPLIVAIEPDRRQTAKLTMIGSNQLRAELFVADSVRQALTTLGERLPDLILVSPLLLPRDLAALNERLRELEKDGFKVPTLTIPVLGVSSQRTRPQAQQNGAPNRQSMTRGPRALADACDPTTFGLQIAASLERAMNERPAAASAAFRPKASSVERGNEDAEDFIETAETEAGSAESTAADAEPEWHDVLSALRRDLRHTKADHSEPAVPAPPAPKPAPPVARAQAPAARPQPIVIRPAAAQAPPVAARQAPAVRPQPIVVGAPAAVAPAPVAEAPAIAAPAVDPPLKKRRTKSPPAQDEWGMFDPQQCGLAALRVKLNELTEGPGGQKKRA